MIRPSWARAAAAMVWLSPRQRVRATWAAACMSSWSTWWVCVVIFSAFVSCQATLTRVTTTRKQISTTSSPHTASSPDRGRRPNVGSHGESGSSGDDPGASPAPMEHVPSGQAGGELHPRQDPSRRLLRSCGTSCITDIVKAVLALHLAPSASGRCGLGRRSASRRRPPVQNSPRICSSPRSGRTPKAPEQSGTALAATAVRLASGWKRLKVSSRIRRHVLPVETPPTPPP